MNNTKLKKGGIDTVVAYIVVAIPLIYLIVFIIGIIYHFSIQSYLSQVAKELAISAGTHGKLTETMLDRAEFRLRNLDIKKEDGTVDRFEIAVKVLKYENESNSFSTGYASGTASDRYVSFGQIRNAITASPPQIALNKKDIIEVYLTSESNSMLASISNFGMFGSGGGAESELKYSSFREEIVRNDP